MVIAEHTLYRLIDGYYKYLYIMSNLGNGYFRYKRFNHNLKGDVGVSQLIGIVDFIEFSGFEVVEDETVIAKMLLLI